MIDEKVKFDGYNFSNVELFKSPLQDNLMDVYFFSSAEKEYLLFKFNHSYVDGKGALKIIQELINIINNGMREKEIKFESDLEYVKKLKTINENRNLKYNNRLAVKGGDSKDYKYLKRIRVNKNTNAVIAKSIYVLNDYYSNSNITYLIPTNIRRKNDKDIYISNLTLPLYLNINKGDDWSTIYRKIYDEVRNGKNLNLKNINYGIIVKMSNSLYKFLIKCSAWFQKKTNRYLTCGNITNLGLVSEEDYKCSAIKYESVFAIPFYQPLFPFTLSIIENNRGIDFILCTRSNVMKEDVACEILRKIKEYIEKD